MADYYLGNGKDIFRFDLSTGELGPGTRIFGQNGSDTIVALPESGFSSARGFFLDGGRGSDRISLGFASDSTLVGGSGDDILEVQFGGGGNRLTGDQGNDTLRVKGIANTLLGGAGDDTLQAAPDVVSLTGRSNLLDGGRGDDLLVSSSRLYSKPFNDASYHGEGNVLTGGQGRDSFQVTTRGDLHVVNDTDGVISSGDLIRSLMDVITDMQPGERLLIGATTRVAGAVPLTAPENVHVPPAEAHSHVLLADGEYAAVRGSYLGAGDFQVSDAGPDLLVAWDPCDGVDQSSAFFANTAVLLGVTSLDGILIG